MTAVMGGSTVDAGATTRRQLRERPDREPVVPHLSHSQAQTILECTGKWHLHYQRGLRAKVEYEALRVGKVVHAASADYFRQPPEGRTEQALLADFTEHWKVAVWGAVSLNGEDWLVENEESLGRQYIRGRAMLEHLWRRYQNSPSVPACKVEEAQRVDVGVVRLVSIPDAYWVSTAALGGAVHVVSIKTSSARPNIVGHLVFSPQHIREALALRFQPGNSGRQMLVHYLFLWPGGAEMRTIPVTHDQMADALDGLENIHIRQERLLSNTEPITWNLRPSCERFCEYAPICMARVQNMNVEAVIEKEFTHADGETQDEPDAET